MQQGQVSVDDRFARFGGKSFAINKITSVEVRAEHTKGSTTYLLWWVIAALLLIGIARNPALFLLLAAGAALVGLPSWRNRHSFTTYRLFLMTSSGEAQAFETRDLDQIKRLRDSIEDAMRRSS